MFQMFLAVSDIQSKVFDTVSLIIILIIAQIFMFREIMEELNVIYNFFFVKHKVEFGVHKSLLNFRTGC